MTALAAIFTIAAGIMLGIWSARLIIWALGCAVEELAESEKPAEKGPQPPRSTPDVR